MVSAPLPPFPPPGAREVLQGGVSARYFVGQVGDTLVAQLMITTEWSDWCVVGGEGGGRRRRASWDSWAGGRPGAGHDQG